jgi:hypothetical protein
MSKKLFKRAALIVLAAILVSCCGFFAVSASSAKASATYFVITNGNTMKLKAGDVVSLKNGATIPAALKQVKIKTISLSSKTDLFNYLRESLPASKFKKPYTVSFSLTAKQITAFNKIHNAIMLNKVKLVIVRRSAS